MPTETRVFEFEDFRIDAAERVLYRGNLPVSLPPKVFDTLLVLVSRAGRVVSRDILMEAIWRDTFVEENNLTQYIFTLRRLLGENKGETKFIETIPRRGYRFVPEVRVLTTSEELDRSDFASEGPDASALLNTVMTESSLAPATQQRRTGRAILIIGLTAFALIVSLGFAIRSGWRSSPSSQIDLRRLTDTGDLRGGCAISPDGNFFAYIANKGNFFSLRLKNIKTESEIVIIPPTEVRLGSPRFSPDGNFIYLSRDNEIFQIPVFGGESRKIASNSWSNFSVSPDGGQIAFPRNSSPGESSSIVVADTSGTRERVVTTSTAPNFFVAWGPAPVFSPDGEHLTAVAGRHGSDHVRIVDIDSETGAERELETGAVWEAIEYIDWRSKSELLVAGKKKGGDAIQIWSVRFPGGSVDRLTNDLNNYLSFTLSADKDEIVAIQENEDLHLWLFDTKIAAAQQVTFGVSRSDGRFGLALAPDGQIVFTARDKNNYDIYSVNPDGSDMRQMTKNAGRNFDPVVSPDDRLIAFTSDRNGAPSLWLMNRDGTDPRQITDSSPEKEITDQTPYFSADGKWIYYVRQQGGQRAVWKISIDGGDSLTVSRSDKAPDKPVPSPDGRFLAYAVYNDDTASPWQVAVQSLKDQNAPERFFDFPAFRSRVRWTRDSNSLVSVDDRAGGYNLWLTNLNTGERLPITNFNGEKIYRFDVSPDGRSYALARGDYFYDAVLIGR